MEKEILENMQKERQLWKYEDEILDLIDNANDITRSDLQGIVSALVRKIAERN